MGWKRIGNHSYFYRSRREGGRVVSEYFGRGEPGILMAQILEIDRQDRLAERDERQAERDEAERRDRAFGEWFDAVETVATGAMLAAGYRNHRGQWRRKRHDQNDRSDSVAGPRSDTSNNSGEADLG